jgi:ligand-binding sensor protein
MPSPRFLGLGSALVAALGCGASVAAQPTPVTGVANFAPNCCAHKEACQGRSACRGSNSCTGPEDPFSCDDVIATDGGVPRTNP